MAALETLSAETPSAEVLAGLERDGAVILADVLDPPRVDAIVAETRLTLERCAAGDEDFGGRRTLRCGALVARAPACRDVVAHPLVRQLADGLLLNWCQRYQLHLTQMICILPGESAQPLHRDRLVWGRNLTREIEPQLNTIWALTDFSEENGATRVIPGSQRWDWEREPATEETLPAEMSRGSVLVYTGSVVHGGGANRASSPRLGMNVTYSLGWLRQEENQYLSCPPEVARKLDPALQELIGYSTANYALGYWSSPEARTEAGKDLLDPERVLGRDALGSAFGTADAVQRLENERF